MHLAILVTRHRCSKVYWRQAVQTVHGPSANCGGLKFMRWRSAHRTRSGTVTHRIVWAVALSHLCPKWRHRWCHITP